MGKKGAVVRFVHKLRLNHVHIVSVPCAKYFCAVIKAKIASMNFMSLNSELFYMLCMYIIKNMLFRNTAFICVILNIL